MKFSYKKAFGVYWLFMMFSVIYSQVWALTLDKVFGFLLSRHVLLTLKIAEFLVALIKLSFSAKGLIDAIRLYA